MARQSGMAHSKSDSPRSDTTQALMARALRLLLLPSDFTDADLMGAIALNAGAVEQVARGMELYALQLNHERDCVSAFSVELLRTAVRLRGALAGFSEAPDALLRACVRHRSAVEALLVTLDLYAANLRQAHGDDAVVRAQASGVRAALRRAAEGAVPTWNYLAERAAAD